MEHEDNAHFDNFLQNRLTESLQNAGSAGNNAADVAAELVPNIGPKTGEHDGEHDDEEEWKYIKEVQQSEKQQQQQQQQFAFGVGNGNGIGIAAVGNGNGNGNADGNGGNGGNNSDAYMSLGMDLSLGNGVGVGVGVGSAAGFRAYEEEEEDVEVIKNDGDFSTNSNTTTTSTSAEVDEQPQVQQSLLLPNVQEQEREQEQHLLHDEEEDEPSSVATTYGTSSLSEQQHEQDLKDTEHNPAEREFFDNKENADPVGFETELESHSQLNPNAVEFVPHFGSQPSSPAPTSPTSHIPIVDPLQSLGRQLLADDLVAESPRKGTRDCNMDTIAVPDESEFDNEAAKRPHELEQEDDNFPDNATEMSQLQLENGGGIFQQDDQTQQRIDHGPETSVDLDADLEPEVVAEQGLSAAQHDDIMKQSMYGEAISNASIEDILNSVQQLPQQTPDVCEEPLKEKELLNVEEKELVSQSPSIEELHQHQHQLHQHQHELVDPMQASFYLEHTSSDAFAQEANDHEASLLLDTSAPFSPLEDDVQPTETTTTTLELQPQQADIVDITPSPISSSTVEKHLVEETKEQQQNLIEEPLILSDNVENVFNAGVSSQMEYADLNTATGYGVHDQDDIALDSNPFAAQEQFDLNQQATTESHFEAELEKERLKEAQFHEQQLEEERRLEEEQRLHQQHLEEEQHLHQQQLEEEQRLQQKQLEEEQRLRQQQLEEEQRLEQQQLEEEQRLKQQQFEEEQRLHQQQQQEEERLQQQLEEEQRKQQQLEEEQRKQQLLEEEQQRQQQELDQFNFEGTSYTNGLTSNEASEPAAELQLEQPIVPEPVAEKLVEQSPEIVAQENGSGDSQVTGTIAAAVGATAAVAAVTAVAATKAKVKASPSDAAKKPAAKTLPTTTAAKAKPSTTAPITKKTTVGTTAAPKLAAARPRTAPTAGAAKPTASPTAAAKPATTAASRKPLAAKTVGSTLSSRPGTAPVGRSTVGSSSLTKTAATTTRAATTTTTAAATRKLTATTTTTTSSNGTAAKSRLLATSKSTTVTGSNTLGTGAAAAAAAKPKVPSPRSTLGSTLRKTTAPVSAAGARSPTKPLANGVAKSSSSTTSTTRVKSATASNATSTTTTTITKTFTARPAPKFTHSAPASGASTARRPLLTTTSSSTTNTSAAAAQRKSSPLKSTSSSPLKLKSKETATKTSSSPISLKGKKPSVGAVAKPAADVAAPEAIPAAAAAAAANGLEAKEQPISHNGNGNGSVLHDGDDILEAAQEALPVGNNGAQQQQDVAEVALLDF